jgi:hypothetical protein
MQQFEIKERTARASMADLRASLENVFLNSFLVFCVNELH